MNADRQTELFPEQPVKESRQTLLRRAAKAKRRERAGWRNLELEHVGKRIGPFRFWPRAATVKGVPMQVLELYCRNNRCRYGSINIAEKLTGRRYPEPGQEQLCPGCGQPAKFMWRVSEEEYREQKQTMFDSAAMNGQIEVEPEEPIDEGETNDDD